MGILRAFPMFFMLKCPVCNTLIKNTTLCASNNLIKPCNLSNGHIIYPPYVLYTNVFYVIL